MDNKLVRFFDKINLENEYFKFFEGARLENVLVDNYNSTWTLYIMIDKMIDTSLFNLLCVKSSKLPLVSKVYFVWKHDDIDKLRDYVLYIFNNYQEKCPTLKSIKEDDINIDGLNISFEVSSNAELNKINEVIPKMREFLLNMGFLGVKIDACISESKSNEIQEMIKQKDIVEVVEKQESPLIMGNPIKSNATPVKNIIAEMNDVTVEVFVFGSELKETASGFNIITYKISDYTDSIYAKIFTKDKDITKMLGKRIQEGSWYRMKGYVKHDTYLNDLVFNIRDIETFNREVNKRHDDAPVKRVELHCHTNMSQMDGLIEPKKLLKKVKSFGMRGVGITDKNGIQCFPKVYKGKEDLEVYFGVELFVVDDEVLIINKDSDKSLMNSEYVVFDTETTGFNATAGDQMIEIGAVKIKNGTITDRFDELINPGFKLKEWTTIFTNITDEMLEDKDDEETVVKRFKEWIGDAPMVAQNARFDISFMESAYQKYNLGTFDNVVLDTMEISKAQNPEATKHSLSALVKRYGVHFEEDKHHRADYDAEGTALVFDKMLKALSSGYETISDLKKLVNPDLAYKMNRPYHVTVYAINNVGLRNMFQIISYATTKYFYKTPRTPKSLLTKHREGLIIGSGCVNGEIFEAAKRNTEEELMNLMKYYDFIEINPPSIMDYLVESGEVTSKADIYNIVNKIIRSAEKVDKMVVATGDVHTLDPEDNIYREILVAQKQPGGGFHPLFKPNIKTIPNAYLMTTEEMLKEFEFLGEEKAYEIVVTNSNKVADMFGTVEIVKPGLNPPRMENSVQIIKDTVYGNAHRIYGEELPEIIATRLDKELSGIINGGYDVIYLIAQRLVENSNAHGYIVGSRGSVGSSLVATFCGITEVNPLPPHYVCPECKKSIFELDGKPLNLTYGSGFDMPERHCECGALMKRQGQDIPFETFLGFNADKTPDIDLNFSGEYQAEAHNYTKVLFGEKNVYRAGTVSTIAEKTAYGFVKIYAEDKGITMRRPEIERLAQGITGIKRTSGQHPGGIIVIPDYKDVFDFTPYQYPAENTEAAWYTTHFEFHDIEENVLKLDILGHDDPTVLKYLSDDVKIDINDIPLDDRGVISLFNSPEALGVTREQINCYSGTLGIPEFGTNFVINMLEEIKPQKFADLIKISGLSHGTDVWNGNARDLILDGTCEFDKVIGCRDDIMLYLIKAGIPNGQAFKMSEFIRKGKVGKDPEKWVEFKQILTEHDVPDWYIKSCEKIKYMFPKAHAAAYVINGIRVAWFKLYHPINYYRVYLSIRQSDFDLDSMIKGKTAIKQAIQNLEAKGFDRSNKEDSTLSSLTICNEMVERGFYFTNISIKDSDATMFKVTPDGKGLIPPFTTLDGMGDIAALKIVEERKDRPYVSIEDLQVRGKVSQALIDRLRGLGALDELPESSQLTLDLFM